MLEKLKNKTLNIIFSVFVTEKIYFCAYCYLKPFLLYKLF